MTAAEEAKKKSEEGACTWRWTARGGGETIRVTHEGYSSNEMGLLLS
jgi:hypothetical protein